jgi:mRNA deadenylase 3'-5' endonuclease subunit Ccr4
LQEVDDKVFSEFLQPHLALAGCSGHFTNKQGRVREGSALFWRSSKWACAAVQDVKLRVRRQAHIVSRQYWSVYCYAVSNVYGGAASGPAQQCRT